MKVLHINQSDISGGAAIAAYRLHSGLLAKDIGSKIAVDIKKTQDNTIIPLSRNRLSDELSSRFTQYVGLNYINILGSKRIQSQNFFQSSDVLNFHNLHGGYFNYLVIPKLTQNKPAVWTLHDMWSFTGHCAYSFDCDKWKTGCGFCPYPETYPAIKKDSTPWEIKIKSWLYSRSNLSIVCPSQWLADQAGQSLLKNLPILHIPYGINTSIYQPLNLELSRSALDIPQDKLVLLMGADYLTDVRKGADLLNAALLALPDSLKSKILLLSFGNGGENIGSKLGIQSLNLGPISSDRIKALAYSAADLFVLPTRADNLPLVLQESMACGTPMVSFRVGGVPELVRHHVTGYLAEPENVQDLRNGIVQLLENAEMRQKMSEQCRAIALQEYTLERQAQRYIELYESLITKSH